ncbi:MAG: hypothetical protein ACXWU0_06330 [Rhodoplanes sp.]
MRDAPILDDQFVAIAEIEDGVVSLLAVGAWLAINDVITPGV